MEAQALQAEARKRVVHLLERLRHATIDHIGMGRMLRPLTLSYPENLVDDVDAMDYAVETATWQAKDKTVALSSLGSTFVAALTARCSAFS